MSGFLHRLYPRLLEGPSHGSLPRPPQRGLPASCYELAADPLAYEEADLLFLLR